MTDGSHRRTAVLDVVGIGFGPSNLALAVAFAEHNAAVPERDHISSQFYEKQVSFGWHRGMLMEGATMQVSYLKDLVTMRNPTSEFTFLAYLHGRGRLADFINHKIIYPSRIEFHDYLEWVAAAFEKEVAYRTEVVDVRPVEEDGEVTHFEVIARGGDLPSKPFVQKARNVVVAGGLRPRLPEDARLSDRVWHTSELLDRLGRLPATQPRSFTVVGAGQSAAETVAYLHREFTGADIHAVFTRYGYAPADDSSFVNRIFDPEAVDHFYEAPEDVKRMMSDYHRSTNYSVVDIGLIDELYRRLYQEKVRGHERLRVHKLSRLLDVRTTGDSVRATVEFLPTGERERLDTDYLVYATGYRPMDPLEVLGGVASRLRTDGDGRVRVRRNYSIEISLRGSAAIYLQGPTEHSHGISSSLLSNTAVRAGEITRAIAKACPAQTTSEKNPVFGTRLDLRAPWSAALLTGTADEGELLSSRMRQEYLVRTWDRAWSPERWIEHFEKSGDEGHTRPFLIEFESRPFAYVEVYMLNSSVLAPHGDWGAHDLGFHMAVIDPELTRRGLGTRFVQELTAALFRQSPDTAQVVAEPAIENAPIRKTLERSGYRLVRPVRLADKTAAMMRCPRPPQDAAVSRTGP